MNIELDHIFILTEFAAPQADLLATLGLVEGASNDHPGQGTSNRRFFFANTTLEFLFVRSAEEAKEGPGSDLNFTHRISNANASPFGLVMRSTNGNNETAFDGWKYCPDYFADDQCFQVGENSGNVEEPLCICMPSNLPKRKTIAKPENADWTLTELVIGVPVTKASNPLHEISKCPNVTVMLDTAHKMALTFNNGAMRKTKDFSADMPLVVNW